MPRRLSPMLLLPALMLGACSSANSPTRFDGALLPPGVRAHDFTLTDQSGRRVSLGESRGRVRLLAFLSPSRRSSLLVAQQIRGALDELGKDGSRVLTLIVSTEPRVSTHPRSTHPRSTHPRDTRAQVGRFLKEASLEGRVDYLTGPPPRLRAIWKAYGVPPASAGEAAFFSSTPILLVDRAGVERVGFPVEQLTPEGLAHDLSLLLGSVRG